MDNTQNMQYGKTWQGLFQAIKAGTFKRCLKKSQRATFQCLIVEDGQKPEWLEAGGGKYSLERVGRSILGSSPA